jgi:hypothetical protein
MAIMRSVADGAVGMMKIILTRGSLYTKTGVAIAVTLIMFLRLRKAKSDAYYNCGQTIYGNVNYRVGKKT